MGTQPPTLKGAEPHPIFGPRLLWPNGWVDQDATWYGGRPRRLHAIVVDVDPATPRKRAHPPHPIFGPCLLWPNGWMDDDAAWFGDPGAGHIDCTDGVTAPAKGAQQYSFRPMSIVATVAHLSYCRSSCSICRLCFVSFYAVLDIFPLFRRRFDIRFRFGLSVTVLVSPF